MVNIVFNNLLTQKGMKKKQHYIVVKLSPEFSPEACESIEEYPDSEDDPIMDDDCTISKQAMQRDLVTAEKRKEKSYNHPNRLATGFALSRKTNYRMSKSSLSPHISPVSQSQLRLVFTPKTSL